MTLLTITIYIYYYNILCNMLENGLDYPSVNSTLWVCHSARQQTRQRGTACTVCLTSDPAHCHRGGGAHVFLMRLSGFVPVVNNQPWKATLRTCSSANLWHWTGRHGSREQNITQSWSDSVAYRGRSSSQPICLYYIVLTKSLCLTILLL